MARLKKHKSDPAGQLLSETSSTVATQKRSKLIFSDSGSDSDDLKSDAQEYHSAAELPEGKDGPKLTINKEYAKRFEHNKKREELHRLEEKYGKSGDVEDSDSSDLEDEDDTAVLATKRLDEEIAATIEAIRKKDPKIYDGKTTFFSVIEEEEDTEAGATEAKAKPMFLRDYHRQNLLSGASGEEDEGTPLTFTQEQEDLKRTVVREMHQAADEQSEGDGDSDDGSAGFLVRKSKPDEPEPVGSIPDPATADPNNPEEYLTRFFNSRAWTKPTTFTTFQDEDSEDEERMEKFEQAYNFRFEDPDANVRGKLVTYGRDIVSANTVRREEKSARKREREKRREKKAQEKELREMEKGRLRKLKTEELMKKFKMIREAAGFGDGRDDEEVEADMLEKLLEGDWSDGQWEEWMTTRFGEGYYEVELGKLKKPKFDDEIDIADIVPDFEGDAIPQINGEEEMNHNEENEDALSRTRKNVKDLQKEERRKKKKDKELKRKLSQYVEDTFDFEDQLPPKADKATFRYRQTTPESYGLTPLEILAAEDADLNSFIGIKKLASFREPEKKKKDKQRYGKKKRLREWRKETFGDEEVKMPVGWKPEGELVGSKAGIKPEEGREKKKRRRRGKGENRGQV